MRRPGPPWERTRPSAVSCGSVTTTCTCTSTTCATALGAPDRAEAADVASALTETEPGLGYIVGRKAALPDGSQVRIELTGPAPTTYDLVVDGRAKVVDGLDGEPTVGIRLPAMTWLRLTGGRVDPEPLLGAEVELLGDTDLARRLGSNLAITI